MVIFVGDCNGTGLPMAVKRTENWTEETFGEGIWLVILVVTFLGPSCSFCHVVLSRELNEIVPKAKPEEQAWIEKVPIGKCDRYFLCIFIMYSSRLSCQITVTKEMDGGAIYVWICYIVCYF